ncbi:MAG: UbiX family flavin prenyltransferase [Nitrospinota bacterium]
MKLVVAITGASGVVYAVRLLEALEGHEGVEVHLIVSRNGERLLRHECGLSTEDISRHAHVVHSPSDIGARPASGSARMDAMAIVPCSVKTLAQIAAGTGDNLVGRAADVILKEGRKLVLVLREAPFSSIHLENMLKLARMGVTILPASPGFYHQPKTFDDLVNHVVGKTLDCLGFDQTLFPRWAGQAPERKGGRGAEG